MPLSLAELERKFLEQQYAPRASDGKVIARKNLISNPSFETNITGWRTAAQGSVARITSDSSVGAACLQFTASSGFSGFVTGLDVGALPAAKNESFFFSMRIKSAAGKSLNLRVTFRNAAGATIAGADTYSGAIVSDGTWLTYTYSVSAPNDDAVAKVDVGVNAVSALVLNDTIKVDAALAEKSAFVLPYFDGASTDDNWTDYRWEGTAHASASLAVEPEPVLAENLFQSVSTDINSLGNAPDSIVTKNYSGDWHRLQRGPNGSTPNLGARIRVPLSSLVNNTLYHTSVEVFNPLSVPIIVKLDWVDLGPVSKTIQPQTSEVIKTSATRATYDDTFRFMDLHIDSPNLEVWFKNPTVSLVSVNPFNGDSPNAVWRGTRNESRSVLKDINARDLNYVESAYFKKSSGLSVGSVADHERAFLIAQHKPVVGDASSISRYNLMNDGSFELGITNLLNAANTTIASETVKFSSGAKSAKLTSVAAGNMVVHNGNYVDINRLIKVKPNTQYRVEMKFRSETISRSVGFDYASVDAAGNGLGYVVGPRAASTTGGWTTVSASVTTHASAAYLRLAPVVLAAAAAGEIHYVDDVLVELSSTYTGYFDGDSSKARYTTTDPLTATSEMTDPNKNSTNELRQSRFMRLSGLSPANKYSISDHEVAYYKSQLGL